MFSYLLVYILERLMQAGLWREHWNTLWAIIQVPNVYESLIFSKLFLCSIQMVSSMESKHKFTHKYITYTTKSLHLLLKKKKSKLIQKIYKWNT